MVVAYAVNADGVREVIGLDLGEVESEAFWLEFLRSLRARGLDGVRLVISDHAIAGALLGATARRLRAHRGPARTERHELVGPVRRAACEWGLT